MTYQTRQTLSALGPWNYSELDFGLAQLGAFSRHAVVTSHGQLEAAAKHVAVQCHDHRLGTIFDVREQSVQLRCGSRIGPHCALEFFQVGPCNERLSSSRNDNRRNCGVARSRIERRNQRLRNGGS